MLRRDHRDHGHRDRRRRQRGTWASSPGWGAACLGDPRPAGAADAAPRGRRHCLRPRCRDAARGAGPCPGWRRTGCCPGAGRRGGRPDAGPGPWASRCRCPWTRREPRARPAAPVRPVRPAARRRPEPPPRAPARLAPRRPRARSGSGSAAFLAAAFLAGAFLAAGLSSAGAAGAAESAADFSWSPYSFLNLISTGSSIVEEGDLTNSPISFNFSRTNLLSTL